MRRASLLTLSALGLLICLVGGTGLFAALTDTADLGVNDVNAAPLAGSADLKLAYLVPDPLNPLGPMICGPYQDNLMNGFIAATGFGPGSSTTNTICLKNEGSQTVDVWVGVINLDDVDDGCTGDELDVGDTTCGQGQLGELSSTLQVVFVPTNCAGMNIGGAVGAVLSTLTSPVQINFGQTSNTYLCYDITVTEPAAYPALGHQLAQSDSVGWTFRFTATAIP